MTARTLLAAILALVFAADHGQASPPRRYAFGFYGPSGGYPFGYRYYSYHRRSVPGRGAWNPYHIPGRTEWFDDGLPLEALPLDPLSDDGFLSPYGW